MQYILSPRAKKSTCENVKSCCYGNIYEGATDTMTLTPGISHDDVFSGSNFWSVKLTLEVRKIIIEDNFRIFNMYVSTLIPYNGLGLNKSNGKGLLPV